MQRGEQRFAARIGDGIEQRLSFAAEADEPFVAHQLRLFRREGIRRVVLCVGHLSESLTQFVGDGTRFGLEVLYSKDGETLVGTGGAVRKALQFLGNTFLVTYGDSYLDIPYGPIVERFDDEGCLGLMTVLHNEGRWDTSNVEFQNGRILDYSKQPTPRMKHIDYGLGMLRAEVFDETPEVFDLATLYRDLVTRDEMIGHAVNHRFYEIGSRVGLAETDAYIRKNVRGDVL